MSKFLANSDEFPEGRLGATEKLVDAYLQVSPLTEVFHFNDLDEILRTSKKELNEHRRLLSTDAIKQMELLDYIYKANSHSYRLTIVGQQANKKGGHYQYIRSLEQEKEFEKQIKKDGHSLTLSTLETHKYARQTRWISIGAFIISVVGLIITILKQTSK